MVKILQGSTVSVQEIQKLLQGDIGKVKDIYRSAVEIVDDVRDRGDEALAYYSKKFDRIDILSHSCVLPSSRIKQAYETCDTEVIHALHHSAERIIAYHQRQMPESLDYVDSQGVRLGNIWRPLQRVGLYVPGGLARYPSSVLMNAIPAKVAGVSQIGMVVPCPDGHIHDIVLAAAYIAGIDEIYTIGGAQAVAALAYGTQTVPRVDKIVGPGNAYVAAAKKYVFGVVGIDSIAGPSEILVFADRNNNPEWIAADLLSQAEHDRDAKSILVTDDNHFAHEVVKQVDILLSDLERSSIAQHSWENNGMVIVVEDINQAIDYINAIAPEHLQLSLKHPDAVLDKVQHAGAIFLGSYTPEAIGDYVAGPSHVLPTSGTARFSSGLSVFDFLKRISLIGCDQTAFTHLAETAACLAEEEGLGAHALSIRLRQ